MKDIDLVKADERRKELEKQEREGKKVQFNEAEEEKVETDTQVAAVTTAGAKKGPNDAKFNISQTSMLSDA